MAVLFGGRSSEHSISSATAGGVLRAIDRGRFDVIFCRNVVIYFDDATQERVWGRFTPILNPGGVLYIGHSERVSGPASAQLQTCGLTTYKTAGSL